MELKIKKKRNANRVQGSFLFFPKGSGTFNFFFFFFFFPASTCYQLFGSVSGTNHRVATTINNVYTLKEVLFTK